MRRSAKRPPADPNPASVLSGPDDDFKGTGPTPSGKARPDSSKARLIGSSILNDATILALVPGRSIQRPGARLCTQCAHNAGKLAMNVMVFKSMTSLEQLAAVLG